MSDPEITCSDTASSSEAASEAASEAGSRTALQSAFHRVPGYLDAATMGLPSIAGAAALRAAVGEWAEGAASASGYDAAVSSSRAAWARLVGVPTSWVAVGSQVSAMLAPVAASLPEGAEVVVPAGDFSSVVFPFLTQRDRGVVVRQVPLAEVADQIRATTSLVAFSLVQSADGRLADLEAILDAARRHGARTVCDTTQAVGWLPVAASSIDVTVCAAYKWLSCPRGVAFASASPEALAWLRPVSAGWYAGETVWESIYGPEMTLAGDARRLDVSPAWLAWVGAAPTLDLLAAAGEGVRWTGVELADGVRRALGMPPANCPILSLADPNGAVERRLREAGCRFATRAGRLRLAFHVWNDEDDVARMVEAVSSGA